jgi:hypothetical protein
MKLRDMIYESCTRIGVSPSWLRKMLPKNLKLSKHTRKDYLKLQQQRDQQPLHQQTQQQQRELVELPTSLSSRHSVSEQQPQDEETFAALGYLLFYKDAPIKVTVNVKTKSIEAMEIAHEIIHNAKTH